MYGKVLIVSLIVVVLIAVFYFLFMNHEPMWQPNPSYWSDLYPKAEQRNYSNRDSKFQIHNMRGVISPGWTS